MGEAARKIEGRFWEDLLGLRVLEQLGQPWNKGDGAGTLISWTQGLLKV
jgi:hypothetical protein